MLHLLGNNKASQHVEIEGTFFNLRDVFKTKEDSFTSSVFSLLFYLPPRLLWRILYNSCYHPNLPVESNRLLSYEFWPRWDAVGTSNKRLVEPDLFLNFEQFHLLIEAKRYDYDNSQSKVQWMNEVRSYHNQFPPEDRKPLYFIAIGGLPAGHEETPLVELNDMKLKLPVNFSRWKRILHEVKKIHHEILHSKNDSEIMLEFILQDIFLAFRLHGLVTGELLFSMPRNFKIKRYFIGTLEKKRIKWTSLPKDIGKINYVNTKPL